MNASPLNLQEFLPYKLSRLVNDMSAGLMRDYSHRFGLNVSQWRMLAASAQLQPTSVTELTEYSGMDKVTVSRSVRELVDRNLLSRELDELDRRRATITLTPEGQRVYEEIAPGAVAFEEALLSVLKPAERKAFSSVMDRLLDQAAVLRQTTSRRFPRGSGPRSRQSKA
ncbi:MarR family winged helix-turn-helix transcriptional regulator [Ottowia thiooxydans]|uniref:DNA-binding MarR family transcriptional regulator n=1 Tax=Ottowia thiooxydans TaxID=219182 RepID=A0ABV2Q8U8_9BURK